MQLDPTPLREETTLPTQSVVSDTIVTGGSGYGGGGGGGASRSRTSGENRMLFNPHRDTNRVTVSSDPLIEDYHNGSYRSHQINVTHHHLPSVVTAVSDVRESIQQTPHRHQNHTKMDPNHRRDPITMQTHERSSDHHQHRFKEAFVNHPRANGNSSTSTEAKTPQYARLNHRATMRKHRRDPIAAHQMLLTNAHAADDDGRMYTRTGKNIITTTTRSQQADERAGGGRTVTSPFDSSAAGRLMSDAKRKNSGITHSIQPPTDPIGRDPYRHEATPSWSILNQPLSRMAMQSDNNKGGAGNGYRDNITPRPPSFLSRMLATPTSTSADEYNQTSNNRAPTQPIVRRMTPISSIHPSHGEEMFTIAEPDRTVLPGGRISSSSRFARSTITNHDTNHHEERKWSTTNKQQQQRYNITGTAGMGGGGLVMESFVSRENESGKEQMRSHGHTYGM